jgi:hypothetical protein
VLIEKEVSKILEKYRKAWSSRSITPKGLCRQAGPCLETPTPSLPQIWGLRLLPIPSCVIPSPWLF